MVFTYSPYVGTVERDFEQGSTSFGKRVTTTNNAPLKRLFDYNFTLTRFYRANKILL